MHASAADGIGVLTVSASQGLVAFSELAMNPRIFVHSFVGFTEKTVCQGTVILK